MSATSDLRAMLDERGVGWSDGGYSNTATVWEANGILWHGLWRDSAIELVATMTPEQAIEATLGRGECELKRANWDDGTCTWGCICSACDAHLEHETGIGYNYCPICGARVVRA